MTPLFTDYNTIGMYRFMDSTGAEYRLTETAPNSGEWVAKDGLFLTYKPAEGRLYFPDGSWWYFGSIAGSAEMDLGTKYPTLFQDRNGNQIKVRYKPARGGTLINGSGRIWEVEDLRQWAAGGATFQCTYVNDSLQHLNTCITVGNLKTGENYQVGIGAASPLTDPFLGQSFGDKQLLGGITNTSDGINAPFYFGYDNGASSGPGELTSAVFPYGGSLHWGYGTGTLAGGRQFRTATTRAYNANDGQGGKTAYLHYYPGSSAQLPVHDWTVLQDPTLTADKAWFWNTNLGSPIMGLNRFQADRKMPSFADVAQRDIEWTWTTNGNPYIWRVTETMDPGHADAKIRRTEQEISDAGNLNWRKEYAYGSTSVLAREHVYAYETGAAYTNKFIRNLLKTVTLKRPGDTDLIVLSNSYDQYGQFPCGGLYSSPTVLLTAMTGATLHDTANYGTGEWVRGNLTRAGSPTAQRCSSYTTGGTVNQAWDGYGHSLTVTPDASKNYAVPSAITANGLPMTPTFDAAHNITQTVGANGATAAFGWDGMKRETSRTLPSGQVINHDYGLGQSAGASWHKVTTGISPNFRWTKTVYDGFGRTLEVISGYKVGSTETAVSKVKTEYTPCACSSIGKTKRTSMPYAASASPAHWTTYDYDEIGRTLKVTPPGNAGFTSYEYGGTTVKTIDPKGKWKKFENDALGNLIKVREPRPGGGADYETAYTYTMLGKLHTVTMARPGKGLNPATVTQVRTFTYNPGGQTTSIQHPENGTVSFLYNADGSVQRKTDAMNQRVEWSYTAEGRPATVRKYWANGTEDTCSKVAYEYGAQTIDGGFAGANLQGRVASATTGCTGQKGGKIDELYSYNIAGAVVTKRVRITRGVSTVTKDIVYTYDGEGKLASTKYPDETKPWVMGYDAMARPNGLTQEWWDSDNNQWVNRQWVNGVSYGVSGELLGMSAFSGILNFAEVRFTETREYNERLQLTRQRTLQGATVAMDLRYVFTNGSNPNNDGRIIQRENVLSGETVEYTYDSLNRLATAATTSTAWGLSFDYLWSCQPKNAGN